MPTDVSGAAAAAAAAAAAIHVVGAPGGSSDAGSCGLCVGPGRGRGYGWGGGGATDMVCQVGRWKDKVMKGMKGDPVGEWDRPGGSAALHC
eukprot:114876-Chlamydomonas_euryale.AAC.1